MQLMVAIVQDEDADRLSKRLNAAGFGITRLSTVGGFLASGNVTVLMGLEDDRVDDALKIIRAACHTRRRFINPTPWGTDPAHLSVTAPGIPLEIQVGGATVFCVPVKRSVSPNRAMIDPDTCTSGNLTSPSQGAPVMNLMLSIVASENAEPVTRALLAAGYRVTRMNTAGGFLRRGNVTLLVGVEEAGVDDVLRIIDANSRIRPEGASTGSGATTFVLDATRFVRV